MKKWIISCVLLIFCTVCNSQNIPLATWRSHFSYNKINILAQNNQGIYGAADHGIVRLMNDNSLSQLTKANGLSSARITCLNALSDNDYVLIGYAGGEIDIIKGDEIYNVLELRDSDLVGNKTVNDATLKDELAYFATDFGIIVVDLTTFRIKENYRSIGFAGADAEVLEIEIINNELIILTDFGIQRGSLNDNLLDFTQWIFYPNIENYSYSELTSSEGKVFAIENDTSVIQIMDSNLEIIFYSSEPISQLTSDINSLFYSTSQGAYSLINRSSTLIKSFNTSAINDLLFSDGIWYADQANGIVSPTDESIIFNGPPSDELIHIGISQREYFGFYNSVLERNNSFSGYTTFDGSSWSYLEVDSFSYITDAIYFNESLILSSAKDGIFNATTSKNLSKSEAQFMPSNSNNDFEIAALALYRNDLWAISYDNIIPLLKYDGVSWNTYTSLVLGATMPTNMKFSQLGQLWIKATDENGLIVFDAGEERTTKIDLADGLPSNNVLDYHITLNDEVWIGTSNGIGNYPEASFAFDPFQIVTPVFGGQLLFDDTEVTAVTTDGGSRLWAATAQGLWLFDTSVSTLISQYNTSNSPLPSNNIIELTYNSNNGEVFILTDEGLVSFRSPTSNPTRGLNSVQIFPNPVPPNYDGLVGIKNLTANTSLKVTTIDGKLIREISAVGGTASWNLRDFTGNRVKTGVYLVFITDQDGTQSLVSKLAVVD